MQVDILNNSISNLNSGVSQINKFIVDNNIVGTSAGVGIGLAAKDAIQSLVNDVLLPSIVALLRKLNMDGVTQILPVGNKAELNFISFIKQMITFILVVMVSFLFVKLAFDYLLGVETTKKDDKPKNGINNNTIKQDTDTKENFTSFYSF